MAIPGEAASRFVPGSTSEQVQPAGVDLRLGEVFEFLNNGLLMEDQKRLPDVRPVRPIEGAFRLGPGAYKIRFIDVVEVPPDAVGFCYPRSTLLRMGVMVYCAVWDPGYRGRGESLMVVHNPHGVVIGVGARVAQLVFLRLESTPSRVYGGSYQGENL
ncbi:MAG: deoxyuridine 5'-triphosphate nucleotidohydrolase [Acidilobus sp.]